VLNIFGEGGGRKLADDNGVPFLGSIPIDIDARILGDKGKPIVLEKPNCEATQTFKLIVNLIVEHYQKELQEK